MERHRVSSSNIESIGYDSSDEILEIKFLEGGIYQYFNVPYEKYESLMNASSKGSYFARVIKDKYRYRRIK
ncbi:MAG TPA: KTSC domain-containing protein [Pyrinomonadaceae bacterium]|jgi:hypothetical protein